MGAFATAADGRGLVEQATARWNDGDLDGYFAGYSSELRFQALGGFELHGVAALRSFYEGVLDAFPDLRIELLHVVADPDQSVVASLQAERGTHTGNLVTPSGTVPATGRPFTMYGATFMRFDEQGRVVEMTELVDRMAFMELASPS